MFKRLLRTINAYLAREMEDLLIGAKTHDLLYHLLEDVIRHGSPAGFDCSPGESKMRVQKLKNYFSNKSAPSLDVARKIMKTEIVRHIFDGGVLNASGTEVPSQNVLQEGTLCQAFQTLLGKEESRNNCGAVSLQDWLRINNRNLSRSPNI